MPVPKFTGYRMPNASTARSPTLQEMQSGVAKPSEKSVLKGKSRTDGLYQGEPDLGTKYGFGEYGKSGN